ncbi:Solute carrier organic anion transporter member 5A1 [Clonorchis sinensis]|uniref:Solute carrier organic anion transporter member 5A1 n=2 Tax=Clonorchis sinensis TaxID=79923 RepID=A0A8T1LY22_CLOSI|nr:Solute carrier organic anion transporter member 5A1 [Clonorchis sinensis]GAA51875.1 solute carrier organic anion transporter family member 4A1 [Clonorchis sinensis]
MPTPYLSRTASQHSPTLSGAPCSIGDANLEQRVPIDWDTNVVNFISACRHPGLVRRTSVAASHAPTDGSSSFKRRHRRNLSAATTVGFGRAPDTPRSFPKPFQSIFNFHPQANNFNSFSKPPAFARPSLYGHTRNISDPTSCWECYRVDVKPSGTGHFLDHPIYPLLHLSRQYSGTSPERVDEYATSGEAKSQASPYLPAWQPAYTAGWVEVDGDDHKKKLDSDKISIASLEERCLLACLQPCATPATVLIGLFFAMFTQTMVVSGLVNSMLTTLERRFGFTTRQAGYIVSCCEGAGVLTTVAISFINGRKHNRLRIVGLATLLMSFAFALFTLPHFIVGPYQPNQSSVVNVRPSASTNKTYQLCNNQSSLPVPNSLCLESNITVLDDSAPNLVTVAKTSEDPITSLSLLILCVAMVLAGIGAGPLLVLAPTYLWDNLSAKQYPLYSAVLYSAGGLGPACGFLAGAGFLSIYIDFPFVPPPTGLSRNDPLWLGAWWMGMLVCASMTFLAALPVAAFPKRLSIRKCIQVEPASLTVENNKAAEAAVPVSPTVKASKLSAVEPLSRDSLYHRMASEFKINHCRKLYNSCVLRTHHTSIDETEHRACSDLALPVSKVSTMPRVERRPRIHSSEEYSPKPPASPNCPLAFVKLHHQTKSKTRRFVLVLRRVLVNPVWFGVTFTTVVEHSIVAAFLTFAAKYIEGVFQIPPYLASIHTGAVVVPGALIGIITGAIFMRHYRPRIDRALSSVCLVIALTVVTTLILMLLGCSGNRIAGLTATYDGQPWPRLYGIAQLKPPNLTAPCNRLVLPHVDSEADHEQLSNREQCSSLHFDPVCWKQVVRTSESDKSDAGPRSLTYFNPCFAGCRRSDESSDLPGDPKEELSHCRCVTDDRVNPSGAPRSNRSIGASNFGHVTPGRCPTGCSQYIVFLAILFLHILCTGLLQNPSNIITLSCVASEDSAVALGFQLFFMRTLAYIPAPIYFGQLFDAVCQYRVPKANNLHDPSDPPTVQLPTSAGMMLTRAGSSQDGSCIQYNVDGLPFVWLGLVLALKLISLISALLTWQIARRQAALPKSTSSDDLKSVDICKPVAPDVPSLSPMDQIIRRDFGTDLDKLPEQQSATTQSESIAGTPLDDPPGP